MFDLLDTYKYKIGQGICIVLALLTIQKATDIAFTTASPESGVNLGAYVVGFFIVIALVCVVIYLRYLDAKHTK